MPAEGGSCPVTFPKVTGKRAHWGTLTLPHQLGPDSPQEPSKPLIHISFDIGGFGSPSQSHPSNFQVVSTASLWYVAPEADQSPTGGGQHELRATSQKSV